MLRNSVESASCSPATECRFLQWSSTHTVVGSVRFSRSCALRTVSNGPSSACPVSSTEIGKADVRVSPCLRQQALTNRPFNAPNDPSKARIYLTR